ncbi:hypothetical protein BDB00DRAFT_784135 [Zychaea mexicana]|uniref:uncharacterized protein n=1 Tax=Zychaea mexicana TaxID=64656 RepID=UPI0022FDDC39|nr:uncharacterized protein BDB00DRAFT_784135 [Zychaea mexicana]KAI9498042.1 hypothetical protein BDB00DRAFT_784135 [Zychaea mexicana]
MKIYAAAILSSLASAVVAFENTVPCLMWSPKDYLTHVAGQQFVVENEAAVSTIWSSLSSDICDANVVAIIDQPGIHLNDLSRSDSFTAIKQYRKDAVTRTEVEYIADHVNVNNLANLIAQECEGSIVYGDHLSNGDNEAPTVAVLSLPNAEDTDALQQNDAKVDAFIQSVQEHATDNYAVIYTSSSAKKSPSHMRKRSVLQRRAPPAEKSRPIFAKYQLFSPAVFMTFAIAFIVIAIVSVGLTWLTGIQTPIRFEGKPKKN